MAIRDANGDLVINHTTPITLTRTATDALLGADRFSYTDSTLSEEHAIILRDFGRKTNADQATRKGKVTLVRELVTASGARRTITQSVNMIAHSDYNTSDIESDFTDLGQFLLDNAADLAAGLFSS
jgi:hypothetical protein